MLDSPPPDVVVLAASRLRLLLPCLLSPASFTSLIEQESLRYFRVTAFFSSCGHVHLELFFRLLPVVNHSVLLFARCFPFL
jgi:hypothetical protein